MKRLKHKLRGRSGFSFAEVLLCTLILLLATAMLAETARVASARFFESRRETEARTLCSSLEMFLQDELTLAEVTVDGRDALRAMKGNAHNLGSGLQIGILKNDGSGEPVFYPDALDGVTGWLVVRSNRLPDDGTPDERYYFPASRAAYRVSGGAYDLAAGLALDWTGSGFRVTVTVYSADGGTALAESAFFATPLSVRKDTT